MFGGDGQRCSLLYRGARPRLDAFCDLDGLEAIATPVANGIGSSLV
jgi:hypothetical protein